jgi:hypothetical protein
MARKFFYVCAGMLMLALSYYFGASTAGAQSGGAIECAGIANGEAATAVIGRYVYFMSRSEPVRLYATSPVPGTSPVIACDRGMVVLENGEVWFWYSAGGAEWGLVGSFSGGPVPALRETWGQVKARYAPNPAAPTSETNDR